MTFIWQRRAVKLEDGNLLISRASHHDDFNFAPDVLDDDMPIALNHGYKIQSVEQLDENRLLIHGGGFAAVLAAAPKLADWMLLRAVKGEGEVVPDVVVDLPATDLPPPPAGA